ncbi:MAG: hypothetical protein GEU88_21225, partial [Solirubrobacterales bacterium]|nr:hypothetical protein [Solirubrobacterales bacterium]
MHPAAGPGRALRAVVVAAVCVGCSLSAHVMAGGAAASHPMLFGTWLAVAAVAFALSGRPWTFGRLLAVLGGGQLVLHPLFDATGAPSASGSPAMPLAHLAASLLLAVLLAHGDRALWRLCALILALLRPLAS